MKIVTMFTHSCILDIKNVILSDASNNKLK